MKKSFWIFLASALALPVRAFAATFEIDFTVNLLGVPLSPWLTGLIALMLAFAGLAFLRRRGGLGMFIAAFAVVLAGLSVSKVSDANIATIMLDVSPKIVNYDCSVGPAGPFFFQAGAGTGGVTITRVMGPLRPVAGGLAPTVPTPKLAFPICAAGMTLQGSDTCEVVPCA